MLLPKNTFVISHVQFALLGLLGQYLIHTRYALPSELRPQPCDFHSVLALIITDVELPPPLFNSLHLLCVTVLADLELTL